MDTAGGTGIETVRPLPERVLFVGREPDECLVAHFVLSREGFHVDVTTHATTVLRMLQDETSDYAVLIVDRDARDLPVDEFARRLRVRHPEIAVAVATATFDVRMATYDAWVERPYEPRTLVEVVRTACIARERRRGRTTAT